MFGKRKTWFSILLWLFPFWAIAQNDTLSLAAYELDIKDLKIPTSNFNQQKVVSGSRTLQDADDLPLTVYVITKEEIQKYGYVTLVDALKHLPGIRVSQPGNALDGETFLMRGLKGNSYTKIMINSIPIKPLIASGMPIGAQLPIQQADRIEVIYGPASTVYGTDASVGIINIILDKKERPTFAQARLNVGLVGGYTDFNVLFGGKIGRNKNTLSFSVYGSTTILDNRPILYDTDVYTPLNYADTIQGGVVDTSFVRLSNYRGQDASEFKSSTIPHLSRLFGADLYFRSWRLNFQQMYRRDHSALGLNPTTVGYGNSFNYFGETITNINFGYSKKKRKFGVDLNFSVLNYSVDNRSSSQYISPLLFDAMDLQVRALSFDTQNNTFDFVKYDSLRNEVYNFYFAGNRSAYANSLEIGSEQVYTYAPWQWLELSLGLNSRFALGNPLITLAGNPLDPLDEKQVENLPLPLLDYTGLSINTFLQAYISRKRWNMSLGIQTYAYTSDFSNIVLPTLRGANPRLSFLYKINKDLNIRAFYGRAFRVPSPYYYANTFRINDETTPFLQIAGAELEAEETTAYELGLRWQINRQIRADITGFNNYTKNFISYNFTRGINNLEDINSIVGYFNNQNSAISISGIQTTFDAKNIIPAIGLDIRLNGQFANSFEVGNRGLTTVAREVPTWSGAAIVSMQPLPKISLSLLNTFQGASTINRQEEFDFGYYLLDVVFRLDLSDKFQGLIKINNVFNTWYSGLQATRSTDDLYYNPQSQVFWNFGLSYRTN